MIENPFETIAAEPPPTEKSEGALPSRGSVIPVYQCPHCKEIFGIDDFTPLEVYFGVDLIPCPCKCTSYSYSELYREEAWKCPNGCFVHDRGSSPAVQFKRYRKSNCPHLHSTRAEARECATNFD